MAIYLDTGKISEVEKFMKMGIIRGVTTNPTILHKDGVTGGIEGIRARTKEVARLIHPYPLSVEVVSRSLPDMIAQALEFTSWADNINIKITIHGPEGETDYLNVVNELANKHKLDVNVTAMMSAQQCLLAALAGAKYVSMFGGRINNMGYNASEEIRKLRRVLDLQGLKAKIIIGSTREILNVIEWLEAGAHIVTVVPAILEGMIIHPYSKETIQMFLRDAEKSR